MVLRDQNDESLLEYSIVYGAKHNENLSGNCPSYRKNGHISNDIGFPLNLNFLFTLSRV